MKTTYTPVRLFKEREKKDCLNCGQQLSGRYCHACGQENIEHHDTFWHLVSHFFNDITHFDSKFFGTIIPLLFKPGFLTKEFLGGRRQRYLEPIRMYVFLSFLCFFIIGIVHKIGTSNEKHSSKLTTHAPVNSSDDLKYKVKWVNLNLSPINPYIKDNATIAGYDSLQSALPSNEKDGIIELQISRMMINYNLARRTQGDDKANENIYKNTLSTIPKVFFILLPLFGLLLKIVFVRRNIYFINHAIFTIHFHCFLFLLFCILYPISTFSPWVSVLQLLLPLVYLYVAMLNVYKQTKIKTFFKFSFLTFTYGFFLLVALLFSIGYSAFTLA